MSLETNIILSLLDVQVWIAHHQDTSRIQVKKQKLNSAPYSNKYANVNKKN